jgi:hypothetical protein
VPRCGPNEIAYTSYACSGIALVSIVAEPAGSNCLVGGEAIHAGLDRNGDGVLEAEEVTSTSYVCAHATSVAGEVIVHTQADVDALAGVTSISGTLTIDSTTLTELSLPSLVSVGGFMCIEDATAPCTLTTVALPALQIVANAISIDDYHLTTFELPELRTCTLANFDNMSAVSLPSLQTCETGYFSFTADSQPTAISLPALTSCNLVMEWTGHDIDLSSFTSGRLQIDRGTTPVLSLPSMTTGDIDISDADIGSIELPVLASGSVSVGDDSSLTRLDLSAFESGSLGVGNNPHLTSLVVSPSASISSLDIVNNYAFPTCAALALWTELGEPPGQISNNDAAGTCP